MGSLILGTASPVWGVLCESFPKPWGLDSCDFVSTFGWISSHASEYFCFFLNNLYIVAVLPWAVPFFLEWCWYLYLLADSPNFTASLPSFLLYPQLSYHVLTGVQTDHFVLFSIKSSCSWCYSDLDQGTVNMHEELHSYSVLYWSSVQPRKPFHVNPFRQKNKRRGIVIAVCTCLWQGRCASVVSPHHHWGAVDFPVQ